MLAFLASPVETLGVAMGGAALEVAVCVTEAPIKASCAEMVAAMALLKRAETAREVKKRRMSNADLVEIQEGTVRP